MRNQFIITRISLDGKSRVQKNAEKLNLSISDFVRMRILHVPTKREYDRVGLVSGNNDKK